MSGADLAGTVGRHPWIDRDAPVVAADWVAMDAGTGLVHIAPGHGEEDYELGKQVGLPIYNPVDDDGRFIAEVAHFAGLTVWDANPKIVEHLKGIGALVASVPLIHTYPHCWRCKNPTLFRATEQWFIALDKDGLRQRALDAIRNQVDWIPDWGEERIFNMVAHRPEWVISRQRVWGVPIVAFYCTACSALLLEERLVEHVADIMRDGHGADEWHARDAEDLLPAGHPAARSAAGPSFRKETDILDVWFDSGCSHAAVLEKRPELRWPAEMYLEGSDQHRGWFHSSLLEAVGTRDSPPYRSVLDPRLRGRRRRAQDVEVAEELHHARGADPEVRRRGAAPLGGGGGLQRGHPPLRRDPEPRSPTRTGASATRAAFSSARSPTSTPSGIACPTISSRSWTAGRCCASAS